MKRAIHLTAIAGLLLFLIAGTAHAQLKFINNCTTITQPGSYIVINNITATPRNVILIPTDNGTVDFGCIVIEADFVTLNLAGFAITGNLGGTIAEGISSDFSVNRFGISVHDGTVANFTEAGVLLGGSGSTVEHIRAVNNSTGIDVSTHFVGAPEGHRIVGNTAISNAPNAQGIYVACPSLVLENAAAGNTNFDIVARGGGCTSAENSPTPLP